MTRVTKTQLALIRDGARPGLWVLGSGGGRVVADPRTIRSLVDKGLAFMRPGYLREDRCVAWLTRAGFAVVGATPTKRHPFDNDKEWP
jgi:hypothetical protein